MLFKHLQYVPAAFTSPVPNLAQPILYFIVCLGKQERPEATGIPLEHCMDTIKQTVIKKKTKSATTSEQEVDKAVTHVPLSSPRRPTELGCSKSLVETTGGVLRESPWRGQVQDFGQ